MPFRDDQDALLARADALETDLEQARTEADALREKNAALDREVAELRAGSGDPPAELAALAAQAGPAAEEAAARRARAAEAPPRRAARTGRRDRLDLALAGLIDDTLVPSLFLVGVPVVVVAVAVVREPWVILPAFVLGLVAGSVVSWLRRRARVAWTRTIPFALDRDSFAQRVADEPQLARLRVRARFVTAPPSSARDTVARAVTGAWGDATGTWDGDDLIVTTAPIASSKRMKPRTASPYSIFLPAPFLRACARLVDGCLRPIHDAYPIAEIAFEDPATPPGGAPAPGGGTRA